MRWGNWVLRCLACSDREATCAVCAVWELICSCTRRRGWPAAGCVLLPGEGCPFFSDDWAVAFALVLCVLSGFIWNVQVVGNNRVGTGTLETYLAQNGVAVGKPWQGTARSRLNYRLLGDFPDLAWAHINKVGATARLEVAERVDTPKTKSDKEQSQWGAARRELRCTVSRLQVHRVQTGRQVCRGVYFYGLTLVPMGKDAPPMTEVTEQRRLLRLNGRALPMGAGADGCHHHQRLCDGGGDPGYGHGRRRLHRAGAKPANRSRSGMKTGGKTCRFGRYFSFLEICQITQRTLASAPPL